MRTRPLLRFNSTCPIHSKNGIDTAALITEIQKSSSSKPANFAMPGISPFRPQDRDFHCTMMCRISAKGNSMPSLVRPAGFRCKWLRPLKERKSAQNGNAKSDPVPGEERLAQIAYAFTCFPNTHQAQIQENIGTHPERKPSKVRGLSEWISPRRAGEPQSRTGVLQPVAESDQSIHFVALFPSNIADSRPARLALICGAGAHPRPVNAGTSLELRIAPIHKTIDSSARSFMPAGIAGNALHFCTLR